MRLHIPATRERQQMAETGPSYLWAQHRKADIRGCALRVRLRIGSQWVRAVVSRPEAVVRRVAANGRSTLRAVIDFWLFDVGRCRHQLSEALCLNSNCANCHAKPNLSLRYQLAAPEGKFKG